MRHQSTTIYGIGILAILPLFLAIGIAILLSAMPEFPKPFLVNPTPTPGQANTSPTPSGLPKTASLFLRPSPAPIDGSGFATVTLEIDSGGSAVTGVQAEITFDAQLINVVNVANGSFFSSPNNLIKITDNSNGRLFWAWAISPGGTAPSGQGVVATFRIQQIRQNGTTSTPLNFVDINTLATSPGGGESDILKDRISTTITLNP